MKEEERNRKKNYGRNVGRYEYDDGDRAEPSVADGEEDIARNIRTSKVLERKHNHA